MRPALAGGTRGERTGVAKSNLRRAECLAAWSQTRHQPQQLVRRLEGVDQRVVATKHRADAGDDLDEHLIRLQRPGQRARGIQQPGERLRLRAGGRGLDGSADGQRGLVGK